MKWDSIRRHTQSAPRKHMTKDPGGSSVVQEIVAETQAEGNNRENESYFREQPAEQNSSPVDCYAIHFPTPVPHVKRSAM
jgi:hypothetical protein